MMIIGVMAVDPSGVIGINNGLPWHYPSELEHFRQVTDKQVIVMGRKTFEAIPQNILKNRVPVVFSRNKLSSCFNRGKNVLLFLLCKSFYQFKIVGITPTSS